MADALSALLNLTSNRTAAPMAGGSPLRNNARVSALAKMLGLGPEDTNGSISQADMESAYGTGVAEQEAQQLQHAQTAALPLQIQGEYSVRREQARGQAAVEAAKQRAAEAAANRDAVQHFQAGENEKNRAATNSRTAMTTQGQAARQTAGQHFAQAQQLRSGKVHAPGGSSALWAWLTGGQTQSETDQAAANALSPALDPQTLQSTAQHYAPFAHLPDEELMAKIEETQPDATPDEHQQLFHAIRGR